MVDAHVASGIWAISISFVTGLWSGRLSSVPIIYDYVAFSQWLRKEGTLYEVKIILDALRKITWVSTGLALIQVYDFIGTITIEF